MQNICVIDIQAGNCSLFCSWLHVMELYASTGSDRMAFKRERRRCYCSMAEMLVAVDVCEPLVTLFCIVLSLLRTTLLLFQVITALARLWHPEHFMCVHCKEPIGTRNFFERDSQPYCEHDYHLLFSPYCASCNGPIFDVSTVTL